MHSLRLMLCATCFLFGGAYALERREHIRMTAVYELMPRRLQRACDVLALLLTLAYLLGLGWFAGVQAVRSIGIMEMSGRAWNFPMPVVIRTAFFLGTALLALQAAANLVALLRGSAGSRP